ncbi:MAG: putative glycoside hydrolase, partial [Kiritimatiellaeota bacterium]|nr:putative glycoside hydrolase [Kiritimatiellota bacterium]
ACFLVAAEANCYLCYTWGYRDDDGAFDWYPEFDKPLGPPKGAAKRTGWIWQRDFAHAAVSVNLETQAARIDWH